MTGVSLKTLFDNNMTKIQPNFRNSKHLAEYLDSLPWDFFLTGSTGNELTLKSARRLAERYFSMMPAGSRFFFVSEKFEVKDGYHIHGLLDLQGSDLRQDRSRTGVLSRWWQLATGNKCIFDDNDRIRWEIWNQIDLRPYMKSVGASGYCAKYINKKQADYDLLTNPVDPGPDTMPALHPGRTVGLAQLQKTEPVYKPRKIVDNELFTIETS
jgi:hypothetical protein